MTVIAITGAGGALGGALSAHFAGEPGTDVVLSDMSAAALEATVDGLGEVQGGVETMVADVGEIDQVEAVVARAVERFGRLDVLISNAGVLSPNGRIHNLSTEDWERAFRVNVLGAVNAIRAAVPVMRQQGSGSIVLTASVSGLTAWSHAAPVLRHQGGGHPPGEGGGGRVRTGRDPGQLRVPGHVPLRHPRRAAGGRLSTPSPAGTRSGWGRPTTWWVRTPTWRATHRPGRPARRSSSTAGTPRPDPVRPGSLRSGTRPMLLLEHPASQNQGAPFWDAVINVCGVSRVPEPRFEGRSCRRVLSR